MNMDDRSPRRSSDKHSVPVWSVCARRAAPFYSLPQGFSAVVAALVSRTNRQYPGSLALDPPCNAPKDNPLHRLFLPGLPP